MVHNGTGYDIELLAMSITFDLHATNTAFCGNILHQQTEVRVEKSFQGKACHGGF